MVAGKRLAGKQATDLKSYLLTLGIFCGGYVSNSFLDEAVGAAEKYFRAPILRLLQNRFQWLHHLQSLKRQK